MKNQNDKRHVVDKVGDTDFNSSYLKRLLLTVLMKNLNGDILASPETTNDNAKRAFAKELMDKKKQIGISKVIYCVAKSCTFHYHI